MAEYEAGLLTLVQLAVKHVEVVGDSMLVVKQLSDEWQTKHEKLIPHACQGDACIIRDVLRIGRDGSDGLANYCDLRAKTTKVNALLFFSLFHFGILCGSIFTANIFQLSKGTKLACFGYRF